VFATVETNNDKHAILLLTTGLRFLFAGTNLKQNLSLKSKKKFLKLFDEVVNLVHSGGLQGLYHMSLSFFTSNICGLHKDLPGS
jgi:hypothetical protein